MPNKTLPISVRISLDDATFLSGHSIAGATTPSEKIRALIREARHRQEGVRHYAEGLMVQEEQMAPALLALREAENDLGLRSEFITLVARWLPETLAYLLAHGPGPEAKDGSKDGENLRETLLELEQGTADRVVSLMENVLRLAITPKNPCYDDQLVSARLESVLELCQLMLSSRQKAGDEKR